MGTTHCTRAQTSKRQLRSPGALRDPESPVGPCLWLPECTSVPLRWFGSKGSDCSGKNLQAALISTVSTLLEKKCNYPKSPPQILTEKNCWWEKIPGPSILEINKKMCLWKEKSINLLSKTFHQSAERGSWVVNTSTSVTAVQHI